MARSTIKEHGEKLPGEAIGAAETAIAELETAMKGDDKGQIEAKSKALDTASQALFAAVSAQQPGAEAPAAEAAAGKPADDVVDAEFTEVKDDEKQ
jgi:molecular chaperone DnaK